MDWTFASDNAIGAHPRVLEAMAACNRGALHGYGDDPETERAVAGIRALVGEHAEVALVATGTAANVLGMAHVTRPHECVVCPATAHIAKDENTAPGSFGLTLVPVPTADGKLRPADVERHVGAIGNPHAAQPRVVSVSQTTEVGGVYTAAELAALAAVAHAHGMLLHVDGARIANAVAALDTSPRALLTDSGVDLVSFGFSKNGALQSEAIVMLGDGLGEGLVYTVKRGMQLLSKGRFLGAQAAAMLEDGLWLECARNANAMARRLADGLTAIDASVALSHPVEANHVFVRLPAEMHARLSERYAYYEWTPGEYRLLCSWATTAEEIDAFVALARG